MSSSPLSALRERFGDWATPVRDVLAAAHDDDVGFFPHYRHKVPGRWGKGPMTLVGDAAHSFPPTRAQGANPGLLTWRESHFGVFARSWMARLWSVALDAVDKT